MALLLLEGVFPTESGASSITLTWQDNANNETGYKIERRINGASYTQIAVVGANVTSFSDTSGAPSTTYSFRVRSYNAAGDSAFSNVATVTTPPSSPVNTAPTISDIVDRSINEDGSTGSIAFTVSDVETTAGSLVVTASSSNPTLLPVSGLVLGGSGSSRTLTATPAANQTGSATITVTVSDGTLTASDTFALTVNPVNDAPTITTIAAQTINEDASTNALTFTIGDLETAAAGLTLSTDSSNQTLVPLGGIVFGGSGADRTVTVTPAANQNGTVTITVGVSDGTATTNTTFALNVTGVNDVPTIGDISNQSLSQNGSTGALALTIGDVETAAASLTLSKDSSNQTLVPLGGIVFGGSGANRTVTVTPAANQTGTSTITVTVSDGNGGTASDTFVVTVSPVGGGAVGTAVFDGAYDWMRLVSSGPGGLADSKQVTLSLWLKDLSALTEGKTIFNMCDTSDFSRYSLNAAPSGSDCSIGVKARSVDGVDAARFTVIVPLTSLVGWHHFYVCIDTADTAKWKFYIDGASKTLSNIVGTNSNLAVDLVGANYRYTVGAGGGNEPPSPLFSGAISELWCDDTYLNDPAKFRNPAGQPEFLGADGSVPTGGTRPVFYLHGAGNGFNVNSGTGGNFTLNGSLGETDSPGGISNTAPTISDLANVAVNEDNSTGARAFTVGDAQTAAGSLTVTTTSSNTALVPATGLVLGGSGSNRTLNVTPAANQSGAATITVTVSDGALIASDSFVLTVNAVNDVPSIAVLVNQTIERGAALGPIGFSVSDVETAASALVVTGGSSNPALVPDANIAFGGSGANRTLTVSPVATQSGTATITVRVSDGSATSTSSFTLTVSFASQALVSSDIGAPALTGSMVQTSTGTEMLAGGSDIWGIRDEFHFARQQLQGDGELTVRVASLTNSDRWAKAGLMFRGSLAENAAHVSVFVTPTSGVVLQWRATTGGDTKTSTALTGTAPEWLRMIRTGDTFYAFRSENGADWELVDFVTVDLPDTAYVGLAVTAHNALVRTTAKFDQFQAD